MIIDVIILGILFFQVFIIYIMGYYSFKLYMFLFVLDVIILILVKIFLGFNVSAFIIGLFIGICTTIIKDTWDS